VRGGKLLKKVILIIASIIYTLILSSCTNTSDKIKPISSEVVNFDMELAKQMIEKGEKIIVDITLKDSVSREEYNQFLSNIIDAYDGYEEIEWNYMFFYNTEVDDNKIDTLRLQNEVFYPTIYHQNIEIVSAIITNTYYENKFFNNSFLTIREEYLGEDSKLNNWYREYTYRKDDNGNWVFYAFGGEMNFADENFIPNYLELK
jgi:hypothetical protein